MSEVLTAENIAAQRRRLVQRMDETATVLRESAARFRDANEAAAAKRDAQAAAIQHLRDRVAQLPDTEPALMRYAAARGQAEHALGSHLPVAEADHLRRPGAATPAPAAFVADLADHLDGLMQGQGV